MLRSRQNKSKINDLWVRVRAEFLVRDQEVFVGKFSSRFNTPAMLIFHSKTIHCLRELMHLYIQTAIGTEQSVSIVQLTVQVCFVLMQQLNFNATVTARWPVECRTWLHHIMLHILFSIATYKMARKEQYSPTFLSSEEDNTGLDTNMA